MYHVIYGRFGIFRQFEFDESESSVFLCLIIDGKLNLGNVAEGNEGSADDAFVNFLGKAAYIKTIDILFKLSCFIKMLINNLNDLVSLLHLWRPDFNENVISFRQRYVRRGFSLVRFFFSKEQDYTS
jgi:hypothetical protein